MNKVRLALLAICWSSVLSTNFPTPTQNTLIFARWSSFTCTAVAFGDVDRPSVIKISILSAPCLPPAWKLCFVAYSKASPIYVPPLWYGILSIAVSKDRKFLFTFIANWWCRIELKVSIPTWVLRGPIAKFETTALVKFNIFWKDVCPTDPEESSKNTISFGVVSHSERH